MKLQIERGELRALAALLGLALLLRLAVPLALFMQGRLGACLEPDSESYMLLAGHLLDWHVGGQDLWGFRVPGYPLFLSPLMALGRLLDILEWIPVLAVQCLLDAASCFLVWLIARRGLGLGALPSLFALFLQCLSTGAIDSSAKVLSECLFTFLLLLSLWALLPALQREDERPFKTRMGWLFSSGALWGAACLTRVVILPFTLCAALTACVRSRRLFPALVFLAPVVLIASAWTLRNGLAGGYWGVSSVASVNLYRYDACAIEASLAGRPFAEVQRDFDERASKGGGQTLDPACKARALEIIAAHPFEFAKLRAKGVLTALLPSDGDLLKTLGFGVGGNGTLSTIQSEGLLAGVGKFFGGRVWLILLALPSIALLLLKYALSAAWLLDKELLSRWALPLGVLALCVIWLLVAGGAASTPRFRVPAEPLLALLAGAGLRSLALRLGFVKTI